MKPATHILSLILCAAATAAEPPPDARAWAAACTQVPPPLYTGAVGRLVERMKAEKLWDKCGLLLFFAAHESSPGAFNLKGCPDGVPAGGTQHIPGRALKGNGVDGWFDTKLHLQDIPGFTLANHGLYAFAADDLPGAFAAVGASGGRGNYAVRPRNLNWLSLWTGTSVQLQGGPITSGVGLGGPPRYLGGYGK